MSRCCKPPPGALHFVCVKWAACILDVQPALTHRNPVDMLYITGRLVPPDKQPPPPEFLEMHAFDPVEVMASNSGRSCFFLRLNLESEIVYKNRLETTVDEEKRGRTILARTIKAIAAKGKA